MEEVLGRGEDVVWVVNRIMIEIVEWRVWIVWIELVRVSVKRWVWRKIGVMKSVRKVVESWEDVGVRRIKDIGGDIGERVRIVESEIEWMWWGCIIRVRRKCRRRVDWCEG